MSSRKTAKGAKVDKAVHDQLAAELDESKEDNVRLKEDNERLKKDLKATVTKHEAMTKTAEHNKSAF
jgi:hypothetical protein